MFNFLTKDINDLLSKLDYEKLYEIRLRINKPIVVNYENKYFYLTNHGVDKLKKECLIATKEQIEQVIYKASNYSLYATNEELKQGFITISGGYRIGISGEIVFDNNNIHTIKNFNSLNIRIPHNVQNCSNVAFKYIVDNDRVFNTLIISPPGAGKTTILRDLVYQFYKHNFAYNCLVIDERYEIASCNNMGDNQFDLGDFCDIISGSSKQFGLENGIRSMRPDIVFTDEIANDNDIKSINYAIGCGVAVITTVHSKNIETLKSKPYLIDMLNDKIFDRYIVLSNRKGVGTYEGIYDKNFNLLYMDL
jgi:stage III sporulation protein AA